MSPTPKAKTTTEKRPPNKRARKSSASTRPAPAKGAEGSAKRQAIMTEAARYLARKPGAGLKEICEKTGISRATLYRYFPNREALIREIALAATGQTRASTEGIEESSDSVEEAIARILEAVVPMGDRYHFLVSEPEAYRDPDVLAAANAQYARLAELIEKGKLAGEIATDIPTTWVVAVIDALIWAAWAQVHDGWLARRVAGALTMRVLWRGIRKAGLEELPKKP